MSPAGRSRRRAKRQAERRERSRAQRGRAAWGWPRTALALAVAVGIAIVAWTLLREPPEVEPPPFTWETEDDGVKVGRVEPEALAEWCRRYALSTAGNLMRYLPGSPHSGLDSCQSWTVCLLDLRCHDPAHGFFRTISNLLSDPLPDRDVGHPGSRPRQRVRDR